MNKTGLLQMTIDPVTYYSDKMISEIVRQDYRTAEVFKKYNINFCCGGQVSLRETCLLRGLDFDLISGELTEATRNVVLPGNIQFNKWKIEFLIDYIIHVHHAYIHQAIPSLELRLISFMEGHKKKFPQLARVQEIFQELANLVMAHTRHEEEIIFPYIRQIDAAFRRRESYGNLLVKTLRKPLSIVEKEHARISDLLLKLKMETGNYTFPANACTNHQVIFHLLKELHDDLVQHKHLENNILFPRAIEIEQQLLQV
jgi:regulator of cell morphogenesis and NO signaling